MFFQADERGHREGGARPSSWRVKGMPIAPKISHKIEDDVLSTMDDSSVGYVLGHKPIFALNAQW